MPREVRIEVDSSTGDFVYRPAVLHGHRKDEIHWICESGPFAVQFAGLTPFASADGRSVPGKEIGPWMLQKPVRDDAEPGGYRYVVAVYAGGKVFIDAGCPVIIIDL